MDMHSSARIENANEWLEENERCKEAFGGINRERIVIVSAHNPKRGSK